MSNRKTCVGLSVAIIFIKLKILRIVLLQWVRRPPSLLSSALNYNSCLIFLYQMVFVVVSDCVVDLYYRHFTIPACQVNTTSVGVRQDLLG